MKPRVPEIGEFYADYDEPSGLWCVFHTDVDDYAFSSFADEGSADDDARHKNALKAYMESADMGELLAAASIYNSL